MRLGVGVAVLKKMIKKCLFRLFGSFPLFNRKLGVGVKLKKGVHICEKSSVGAYSYVGPNSSLDNATIGRYCSIAPNVYIGPGHHAVDFVTTSQRIAGDVIAHDLTEKRTIVGNDVWIGVNAVILQGVIVGDGAVIGANSVVTKDVDDYSIVAGIPARELRKRFTEDRVNELKKSRWFDLDVQSAKRKVEALWSN